MRVMGRSGWGSAASAPSASATRAARASVAGIPIPFARRTGIRSRSIFMRNAAPSHATYSDAGTAGVDRPQRLHAPIADTDIPIMQIDRRIAVSGDEPELFAEREGLRARPDLEFTVLVRDAGHFDVAAIMHPRRAALGAVRLEACVHDGSVGRWHADHRCEHKQTMFEFRVGTIVAPADTRIFGVHEYIRADLQLIINAARRLDGKRPGPGAADDLTGKVLRGQRLQCLAHRIDGGRDGLRAFVVSRHVLRAAMIG